MTAVMKSARQPTNKKTIKAKLARSKPRGIEVVWRQFQKDLAELLRDYEGQWVTYEGRRRIEIGIDQAALILRCLDRGLRRDEFMVCRIEPAGDDFSPRRRNTDFE